MRTETQQLYVSAARCGTALRRIRERQRLSVTEVARRAGFTQQQLSAVELGKINTPIETLGRLADVLGVPLTKIVGETEKPEDSPLHAVFLALKGLQFASRLRGLADEYEHILSTARVS